jgi:hypothetical protein
MRVLRIRFGMDGNARDYQIGGWSAPEAGFTWSEGTQSSLEMGLPPDWPRDADTLVELELHPFMGGAPRPRLAVFANGWEIGQHHPQGWSTFAFRIPTRALVGRASLRLDLHHPDASKPGQGDTRTLAMMVRSLALVSAPSMPHAAVTALRPLTVPEDEEAIDAMLRACIGTSRAGLAAQFESLGHNCEFGLAQFHLGMPKHEGIGLFRFAGVELKHLLTGLAERFATLGNDVDVAVEQGIHGPTDLLLRDPGYNITWHSFEPAHLADPQRLRAQAPSNLRLRRRLLLERMENAERIFVFKRAGLISHAEILPLLARLRAVGPCALLYVDQSEDLPSGAVEQVEHGLFHGKLARMAPAEDAGDSDVPSWISLLANTILLNRTKT